MTREFLGCERGAVAVLFGLFVLLLIVFSGVAIDYSRAVHDKANAQRVVDAAVLAAAISYQQNGDKGAAIKRAHQVLKAQGVKNNTYTAKFDFKDSEVVGVVNAETKTSLLHIFNFDELKWSIASAANYSSTPIVDYALAIDISSSMRNGGHMPSLRAGLQDFSEAVFSNTRTGDISVSLVPFANGVAFPASFSKWLSPLSTEPFMGCFFQQSRAKMASLSKDGIATSIATPDIRMKSGLPYCPRSSTQISFYVDEQDKLDRCIDQLKSYQGTATASGLSWAWRLLDPSWSSEFGQSSEYPKDYAKEHEKILVVFTDGRPFVRPWVDRKVSIAEKDVARAEALEDFKAVCEAIKDDGRVHLFAIGYGKSLTTEAREALQNCVAGEGKYLPADQNNISDVFRSIVLAGRKIALTR